MNTKKDKLSLILLGAGGHSKSSIDVIKTTRLFDIKGLIGLEDEVGKTILGYQVIGHDQQIEELMVDFDMSVVTLGQIKTATNRKRLFEVAKKINKISSAILSPHSYVSSNAIVGHGTIVFHGAIVNSLSQIGENCIINSLALIEHDAIIGSHSHISTGARVNGHVEIGEGCFLGSGCVIKEGVSIGDNSVIGMGEIIKNNCPDNSIISNN